MVTIINDKKNGQMEYIDRKNISWRDYGWIKETINERMLDIRESNG